MRFYQLIAQPTSSAHAGLHAGLICSTPQHIADAGRGRLRGNFEAHPGTSKTDILLSCQSPQNAFVVDR